MSFYQYWDQWLASPDAMKIPEVLPSDWQQITLPHLYEADKPISEITRRPRIYARGFRLSESRISGSYYLHIAAASHSATLFINNHRVGTHRGAASRMTFDITRFLYSDCDNLAVIVVDDSPRPSALPQDLNLLESSGLLGEVALEHLPAAHFRRDINGCTSVFFSAEPRDDHAMVTITALVRNPGRGQTLRLFLEKPSGGTVLDCCLKPREENTVRLPLPDPVLWTPGEESCFYNLNAVLSENGEILDFFHCPVGIRRQDISDGVWLLNGLPLTLRGLSIMPKRKYYSAYLFGPTMDSDLLAQTLNLNFRFCPMYPIPRETAADAAAQGIAQAPALPVYGALSEDPACLDQARFELTEIIYQNYNSPSVLFWTTGMDLPDPLQNPLVHDRQRSLHDLAKELDPLRPVLIGLAEIPSANESLKELADIFVFRLSLTTPIPEAVSFWQRLDVLRDAMPELLLGLEVVSGDSAETPAYAASAEYQLSQIEARGWLTVRIFSQNSFKHDMLSGLICDTTSAEYKDFYYLYKSYCGKEPFVHISKTDLPEMSGLSEIKVYGNVAEAELFINGAPQGVKALRPLALYTDLRLEDGISKLQVKSPEASETLWLYLESPSEETPSA